MSIVKLATPVGGWCAPLEETSDPVFAQRMLGDGVAIDPIEGVLCAPCDAEVISVAPTRHAIALRTQNGAELLLHVGLDTVALGGEGFRAHVAAGAQVLRGDVLLEFDLEALARGAKSLLTPIIVTNGERYSLRDVHVDCAVERGAPLFEIVASASQAVAQASSTGRSVHEDIAIGHAHGIHARPAALLANFAKRAGVEIVASAHGRSSDARSAVGLMSLGVRQGDVLRFIAHGERAEQALRELRALIENMKDEPAPAVETRSAQLIVDSSAPDAARRLRGVIASRGLAIGRAAKLNRAEIEVDEAGRGAALEAAELERARGEVRTHLEALSASAAPTAREVLAAHLEFLDDWELSAAARRTISLGKSAGYAWRRAVRSSVETLRSLGDPRLAERVDDLLDLESQVLLALRGAGPIVARELPERSILIAEDIKPSQFVALDASRIAGVCLAAGGPTSHVAILAAAMGVPALVAVGEGVLNVAEGEWLVLDAETGFVTLAPNEHARNAAEATLRGREQRRRQERERAHMDARTADGVRIEVFANIGSAADARTAVEQGAEGCGLLRTEFLFLDRDTPPDEEEQLREYQAIADALGGRPLIARTLDVGGDKPLAYLPLPTEANPALGLRGVRASLWRPDLLLTQLRAMLRVRAADLRVLLPMISDVAEVRAVRRMLEEAAQAVGVDSPVQIGAMIETPASALLAAELAREVDFFSIGTNDLTQYALAMDRGHHELAHRIDGLHPAVLRLIASTISGAERYGRLVAVCGGLASDPLAAPLLVGLGVRELSVTPRLAPRIKSVLRQTTLDACAALAREALTLESAEAVRSFVARSSASEQVES